MVSFKSSVLRKIGIGLACFGTTISIIGLFLGYAFLVIGDIQLICGLILIDGRICFMESLKNPQNYKASLSLVVGFVFILAGWPKIGLILESYAVAVLFSGLRDSFSRKLMMFYHKPPSLVGRQKGKHRSKKRICCNCCS